MQGSDEERKVFFERARRQAEEEHGKNPKDTGALTRWGGALLELANFVPGEEAAGMVNKAVDKFQRALDIDPRKHDALWCLGNAFTSQGFLSPAKTDALALFDSAKDCFRKALAEQPDNPIYQKGLEMTNKAPELYDEIQKQLAGSTSSRSMRGPKQSTFWWDVLGYVTVVGFVLTVSSMISTMNPAAGPPAQLNKN